MTSRRVIPGVLNNFLGTFTSRYSDFDGYWVFGLLVESMDTLQIDLLARVSEDAHYTPSGFARGLAVQKFSEQITKARLSRDCIREAYLNFTKLPESALGFVNGWSTSGYLLRLQAHVVTDLGRKYDSTVSIFVAPHDPNIEFRSTRAAYQGGAGNWPPPL